MINEITLTKEDYFRAADIMSRARANNVEYTAMILSNIIPMDKLKEHRRTLTPDEIADLINEDGRPVREIAKAMGVGYNTIYRWMAGDRTPDEDYQKRFLEEVCSE